MYARDPALHSRVSTCRQAQLHRSTIFRLDCTLSPGSDNVVYRAGTDVSAERPVTSQGAGTLNEAGSINLTCHEGNGHTDTLLSGELTVIAVSGVN